MTSEEKAQRIDELEKQIKAAIEELYELVAPTPDEINTTAEMYMDDSAMCLETLTDTDCLIGKLNMSYEAQDIREIEADEEEES